MCIKSQVDSSFMKFVPIYRLNRGLTYQTVFNRDNDNAQAEGQTAKDRALSMRADQRVGGDQNVCTAHPHSGGVACVS